MRSVTQRRGLQSNDFSVSAATKMQLAVTAGGPLPDETHLKATMCWSQLGLDQCDQALDQKTHGIDADQGNSTILLQEKWIDQIFRGVDAPATEV